jgi:hypothetical protein
VGQVGLRGESGKAPEPKGKLDAMTGYSFTTPVWEDGKWAAPAITAVTASRKANGPEDRLRDAPARWDKIRWREHEVTDPAHVATAATLREQASADR